MGDALAAHLVRFVRHLRGRGLPLGPGTAAELAAAIDAVGLADRTDLYYALRAVVMTRPSQRPVFDEAFDAYFGSGRGRGPDLTIATAPPPQQGTGRAQAPVLAPPRSTAGTSDVEQVVDIAGGSHQERLARRDFADLTTEEQEQVRRLIERMAWRPASAPSRRWAASRAGSRPDLRRTLRSVSGPHGDLVPLAWSDLRMRRRPLVVIADVSGSMERYTELFLYFIHAAQGRLGRVESFVFATRLSRITRQMRLRQPHLALRQVAAAVSDWSGGTRIGEALASFNRDWSRRVTRGGAIGLVISDGWDTGDPELLDSEMGRFGRSVHRVIWLNPLAGRTGFAPDTRGMRTVLPYVDDFLPAANLVDLRGVVRLLESLPKRRGARD